MAERHIGHGSQVAYIVDPERSKLLIFLHAFRIAVISAWAVGSFCENTRFPPLPIILPSITITAPNGPPILFLTDENASSKATLIYFSLDSDIFN